jgi:uncharacterized protein
MTAEQIQGIIATGAFPGARQPAAFVETHISWVILTPDFAFKIKKPVTFGFLDFGTLEKRHHFCQEELRLNSRLAPEMYLGVLPIAEENGQPTIGATDAPPIDYAVQMRRMDDSRQMDKLLDSGRVTAEQLEQLAAVLVPFHRQVVLRNPPECHPAMYWADFAELYRLGPDMALHLGPEVTTVLQRWRSSLPEFLEQHSERLAERARTGFWVDGHGDLHAKNIFLLDAGPVVFDCIEFSDHFRQADILNELAFLCMDLEARGQAAFADAFLKTYRQRWEVMPAPEDAELFQFFKAYRANVRLKVALLELRQHSTPELKAQVQRYWRVLAGYLEAFA